MSSKKKRLGSRRRAPNQNETFNTDVIDSTSVAQCHIPEETESLNATANSHEAQRETQRSPSPDPLGNTRKLGSSRRHRVKNVQDSVTDSHQNSESTEEVEHSSRGAALHPERQADVLLDSASGARHAIVTNRPEVDLESFISIGENETQKSDISHSEEVKENVGVGVSELASDVTCQTDQQLIDSSSGKKIPEEKLPNVCSVTEEQRDDNTEMFISSTTEITTESIHTAENTANECSLQGTISSPKVEMPAEVEQNDYLHLSEVAQAHLEDAVNKGHENEIKLMGMHEIAYSSESVVHDGKSDNDVYDTPKPQSSDIERDDPELRQVFEVEGTVEEQDVKPNEGQDNLPKVTAGDNSEAAVNKLQPTENQEMPQIDLSSENVTHDATDNSEIISRKPMHQTEVSDTYLYKLAVTNTDGSLISLEESGSSLQTLQSDINVPSDPQLLQKDSIGHRRKMGSSRKSKGRPHVKDSGAESDQEPTVDVVGNTRDYETHEETEMALKKDLEVQERSMETFLKETDTFDMTQTEGVSDQVKGNAQDDNLVSIDLTISSSAVDHQIVEHSNFRQTSDKELPKVCCVTEKDNRESSVALEISTALPEEHNKTECTVEQAEFSPSEDKLSINEGQKQPVTGTWHSHKLINQTKKEHESQETNVSKEIPKVELFSVPPTSDPCDFGLKQAETTVDVSEQSGTSSLQGMQEPNNSDDIVILHGRSTQKRRKMGSTRQTQFSGKRREKRAQTQESDPEADTGNLERMEKVEELTTISTAEVSRSENAILPQSVVYKEQQDTNEACAEEKKLIGLFKDTSKALPPEQSVSLSEEVVDPVEFVAADAKHHKGNAAVSGEPSHDTSPTEVLNTTNPRLSSSKDTPNYSMTGAASVTACEPTKSTRNDEERVENVDITKDIALISTEACVVADLETVKSGTVRGAAEEHITTQAMEPEPDNAEEAAPSRDPDMENAGPCLDPKNRRRKMGSTRRNLRTGSKQEDLHQTQDVSDRVTETVTNVADVRIESSSSKKDELQVDAADKDGGTETTESSHTSESHKPPPHRTFEENPVSQGRMLETEHQAAPSYLSAEPSTPPKDGLIAESAFGGRRRKMGSNRKSHQSHENQIARVDKMKDTQNERDVRSIREENPIETEELREESSKVDQSHKKQLANLSSSKEGDDATPVSEKTPEPVTAAQQYAGFQSQMFSLEDRSDLRSKAYNVMMVGDSSVGKSSFMKRAQSGKFSLDLPASVGLDYCMWTVLVEGKPVVLQLWDTAGQERFHSITKQTFHKAHAFLLMYDITCSQSFFAVSYWERCIREAAAEGVTIILVGNKSDGAERQVKSQEADILAAEYKFEFMECSAATGENVVQCLETVARMLSQKDETREDNMVLRKEPQQKTKSRCC